MSWFATNLEFILGGGLLTIITSLLSWFFGGKQAKSRELKRSDVDIKTAEVDYASKVSDLYETLLQESKLDKENLKAERDNILQESKDERVYFREQIDIIRQESSKMQEQFNNIQIAYAKEVELSQNWEKLHRQLTEKYNELDKKYNSLDIKYNSMEKEYEDLKKAHNSLKKEFDKHKLKSVETT